MVHVVHVTIKLKKQIQLYIVQLHVQKQNFYKRSNYNFLNFKYIHDDVCTHMYMHYSMHNYNKD